MEINYSFSQLEHQPGKITLDKMLSRILWTFQPVAVRHNSFIVNDIAPGFCLGADEKMLERTLGSLLVSVISRSCNSCIRVSAKRFNDIVLLRIKDSTGRFSYDLEEGLKATRLMARKLGGCVVANDLREKYAMVTLTFSNSRPAA